MKKILIVEDDIEAQNLYKEILSAQNFEVIPAANAQEAFQALKNMVPDLILLDIMLPGGQNGFDVLEQIKRSEHLKAIPVIVLTNLDTEEDTARKVGATDYIVKTDATLDNIVQRVKTLLAS